MSDDRPVQSLERHHRVLDLLLQRADDAELHDIYEMMRGSFCALRSIDERYAGDEPVRRWAPRFVVAVAKLVALEQQRRVDILARLDLEFDDWLNEEMGELVEPDPGDDDQGV